MNYQNSLLDDENPQSAEEINNELRQQLPTNALWIKLYAVCYLIFNIIFAIFVTELIVFLPFSINWGLIFSCIVYVGVSFWSNIVLFSYSNKLNTFIQSLDISDFTAAVEKRKLFWQTAVWAVIALFVLLVVCAFSIVYYFNP